MGQRHNRRRTRPRSRNRSISITAIEPSLRPVNVCSPDAFSAFECHDLPGSPSVSKTTVACDSLDSIPIPSAHTWHHGYPVWELRERKTRLEAEQYRLFGGEPGDDIDLCYRMLEYFGRLDYIDASQSLRPLPG